MTGDPLCFAAGWLRVSPNVAFVTTGAGKLLPWLVVSRGRPPARSGPPLGFGSR